MKETFVVEGLDTSEKKQEAEKILKQLGYQDDEDWNNNYRDNSDSYFILASELGKYAYHRHPCSPQPLITLTELKSKVMNNVVIKAVKEGDGEKIIEYFKSKGVNTHSYTGSCYEEGGDTCIYYGVVYGEFSNHTLRKVAQHNATIIELPSDDKVTWTREQFKELYSIACNSWKDKLNDMFSRFSTQDEMPMLKVDYEEMRDACTVPQREVLDKIFGADPFKKDVYFMCMKTLDNRFQKGNRYRLIKRIGDGYVLENNHNREHMVSIGSWADYFYKID